MTQPLPSDLYPSEPQMPDSSLNGYQARSPRVALTTQAPPHRDKDQPSLPEDWQYESAVETVESIIDSIETGDMPLAELFDQFAIAVQQLQTCETFLHHHRQQVDLLVETLTDDKSL